MLSDRRDVDTGWMEVAALAAIFDYDFPCILSNVINNDDSAD